MPEVEVTPRSVFSPRPVVFALEREEGPDRALDLACVALVAERWREAIISQSNDLPDAARELLSGHTSSGAPLGGPHLAFLPMALVGTRADGRLLGMGLVMPEATTPEVQRAALRAIGRVRRLALGRLGAWRLSTVGSAAAPWSLRPEAWTAHPEGARHWSTVTPVVFDRHPKAASRGEYQHEVAAMMAGACTRIGLPEPREVVVTRVSAHHGVPPSFEFPRLRRKDGGERRHAHAILVFEQPVVGPVIIGAGRYRGYGAARPVESQ